MITLKYCADNLHKWISAKTEYKNIILHEQTEVSYGWANDIDKDYCQQNNIPCYNLMRGGGTIVYSKGNVSVGFFYDNKKYKCFMLQKMCQDFKDYLVSRGLNATIDHNDILIDGYKVASCWSGNILPDFRWTLEFVQISINQDIQTITNVCLKPMTKIPKGLGEYGVTTQQVLDWTQDWLTKNTY